MSVAIGRKKAAKFITKHESVKYPVEKCFTLILDMNNSFVINTAI